MADEIRPIHEARALLLQFSHSKLKATHVATDWLEFFASRDPEYTARSRLAGQPLIDESVEVNAALTIEAPHLGTIASLAEVGSEVRAGDTIAEITVLDRVTGITAEQDGTISSHDAEEGSLVEYGQKLLEIA